MKHLALLPLAALLACSPASRAGSSSSSGGSSTASSTASTSTSSGGATSTSTGGTGSSTGSSTTGASTSGGACLPFVPTTTLTAETSNNTSASPNNTVTSNGYAYGHVSKLDVHRYLDGGATAQVFAHLMVWFGASGHKDVGYASNDPAQIAAQLDDMRSRGIQGVFIDWYGHGASGSNARYEDTVTDLVRQRAESYDGGFFLVVQEDGNELSASCDCASGNACACPYPDGGHPDPCSCSGANDCTDLLIANQTYAAQHYYGSPAYWTRGGRPVAPFFSVPSLPICWSRVRAQVPDDPLFVGRNASAFTNSNLEGGYCWIIIDRSDANDWGQSYLDNFYSAAKGHTSDLVVGCTYKGFDDLPASWHPDGGRLMNQSCGDTWLHTWDRINAHFGPASPIDAVQLATWNDYEEGTELESGIDDCVSIAASLSGTQLSWTLSGDPAKVDHLVVYVSEDGEALMPVATLAPTATGLDLGSLALAPGSWTLYVQAIGLPSFLDQMSSPISYAASGSCP